MKQLLFLTIVMYCCKADAQADKLFKNKLWEKVQKNSALLKDLPDGGTIVLTNKKQEDNEDGVLNIPLKGTYLSTTTNGDDVYAMTPDKMPSLVPGKSFKSNMPVASNNLYGNKYKPRLKKLSPENNTINQNKKSIN